MDGWLDGMMVAEKYAEKNNSVEYGRDLTLCKSVKEKFIKKVKHFRN